MTSKYTRGSKWRRWDLHFHTPSSNDYENKSVTNKDIIDGLIANNIEVVAITDHHFIDIARIKALQTLGQGKVTILPGIEFRSELGGSESIHFIGIFPEDSDIESIWIKIQSECKLTPQDFAKKKQEEIYCDFKDTAKLIHKLNGVVTVHAGSKSNTIEKITNTLGYKMAIKKDLVSDFVDIYELGNINDKKDYEEKVFPVIKKIIPLIICSDNHNIKKYLVKENLWIKSDPTFEGLKQIIHEPQQRVYIGETPYKLEFIDNNKELFVDSITITSTSNEQEWFDNVNTIKLNGGLVTIIGNKGNGKSALADIIGMSSNANTNEYSFLNKEKFLNHPKHFKYKTLVKFCDGIEYEKPFTKPEHNKTLPSKVVYLSQSFVRELCEDLETSRLQNEIDRVIFSHIPAEEQLGKNNLKDLLSLKNKNIDSSVASERAKLHRANLDIEEIEKQLKKDYLEKIKNKLQEKQKAYELLEKSKPEEIAKPEKLSSDITKSISAAKGRIRDIKTKIKKEQLILNEVVQDRQELENLTDRLNTLKHDIQETITDMKGNATIKKYSLNAEEILKLEIKLEPIEVILKTLRKQISEYKKENKSNEETLKQLNDDLKKINKSLDDKQKQYQLYLENIEQIEKKKLEIYGDKNTKDTIIHYQEMISNISNELPKKLTLLIKKRDEIAKNILSYLFQKRDLLPSLYDYTRVYSETQANDFKVDQQNFIAFDSKMKFKSNFTNQFLNNINKGRRGSFYGKDESVDRLRNLMKEINTDFQDELLKFPYSVLHALNHNLVDDPTGKIGNDIDSQLLVNSRTDIYDILFSFDYLEANFGITFGGIQIQNLSPGERGTLLLIFYLLIDKDKRPIIIDQPEENLDNETVFQKLVPFIKFAKNERQIILVTHNPNLAIVCDSEQIIHSKIDKINKNLVQYNCGSIEFSKTRETALNILEGTEPAFKNRKSKYNI